MDGTTTNVQRLPTSKKVVMPLLLSDSPASYPDAAAMKNFADRFTKPQWKTLCSHQIFLDTFSVNLKACGPLAEKLLAGKKIIPVK